MLDLVTRLLVVVAYAAAAGYVFRQSQFTSSHMTAAYRFIAVACAGWAVFYVLAAGRWLVGVDAALLSRMLHVPLAVAIVSAVWARRQAGQ